MEVGRGEIKNDKNWNGKQFFFFPPIWIISFVNLNTEHLAKNHFVIAIDQSTFPKILYNGPVIDTEQQQSHTLPLGTATKQSFSSILIC